MLTREIPEDLSPRLRKQIARVKEILLNVRWDYGPHSEIEVIPAE